MIPDCILTVDEDIQLIPPVPENAASIFQAIDEHRESLRIWLPFVDTTLTQQDSEAFLESIPASGEWVFTICFRNQFAGLIGLKSPDHANKKVEIGYWIIPTCEGKGIVTRACKKLIGYAFEEIRMNRILIQVCTENIKSRRIPERLGFKEEGVERDGELLVSGYADVVRYGLLKREYNGNY